MSRWAMVGVSASMLFVVACGPGTAAPATTLAPIVTAVSSTTTTSVPASVTTRPPVVTLPPDTTTSTTTTTTSPPTTTSTLAPGVTAAATTTTSTPTAAALVLRDDGLGDARFGADPDAVVAYVASIIGRPTADSGWADPFQFGICPGSEVRSVAWGDLTLLFGDDSVVTSSRRHFFTWTLGPAFGGTIQPAGMVTDADLGVGATVAQLRGAYPDIRIVPGDENLGPNFVVSDELTGELTGTGDTDRVLSLSGGIPCGE